MRDSVGVGEFEGLSSSTLFFPQRTISRTQHAENEDLSDAEDMASTRGPSPEQKPSSNSHGGDPAQHMDGKGSAGRYSSRGGSGMCRSHCPIYLSH